MRVVKVVKVVKDQGDGGGGSAELESPGLGDGEGR